MTKPWPELNSPEDADATHRWARACLELWEQERAGLILEVAHLRHAMRDADKMADDPVTARAILRAALRGRMANHA